MGGLTAAWLLPGMGLCWIAPMWLLTVSLSGSAPCFSEELRENSVGRGQRVNLTKYELRAISGIPSWQ